MRRQTKSRVLFVVPHESLWYPDYGPVREVLDREEAVHVTVASSDLAECKLSGDRPAGAVVRPDVLLDEAVEAANYDAIVFCGYGVEEYLHNRPAGKNARRLIEEMHRDKHKVVAALCVGQRVLAATTILKGQEVARPFRFAEDVERAGAILKDDPVIASARVVTGKGPEDAVPFARALLREVSLTRKMSIGLCP